MYNSIKYGQSYQGKRFYNFTFSDEKIAERSNILSQAVSHARSSWKMANPSGEGNYVTPSLINTDRSLTFMRFRFQPSYLVDFIGYWILLDFI